MLALAVLLLLLQTSAESQLTALPPLEQGGVRVLLVRHGQALSNLDPPPPVPETDLDRLTPLGRRQAEAVATAVRPLGVVLLLSSPAGRAQETAAVIREALAGTTVRVEPRVRPLELGRDAAGAPLEWDVRIAQWRAGEDPSPPGGESLEQLGGRVAEALAELPAAYAGRTVIVVAHSEVIAAFLGRVRGMPAAERYTPRAANGSISVVDVGPQGGFAERLFNFRPSQPEAR
jgi:broad specificity phosphatase PhoE